MLEKGAAVPHFEVDDLDGRPVRYTDIWQRRPLVLVTLAGRAYAADLAERLAVAPEAALVVTADAVPAVPPHAVVVADRWGEVYFAAGRATWRDLPAPGEVVEWVAFVERECPECQGEAR
jgi:hypothetical protein